MRLTPEEYFRTLRMPTSNRQQARHTIASAQNTFLSTIPVHQQTPSESRGVVGKPQ